MARRPQMSASGRKLTLRPISRSTSLSDRFRPKADTPAAQSPRTPAGEAESYYSNRVWRTTVGGLMRFLSDAAAYVFLKAQAASS